MPDLTDLTALDTATVVRVHRAEPTRTNPMLGREVTKTVIAVESDLPEWDRDRYAAHAAETFADDANRIADALQASLPGGTLDRLLAELLRRKASQFRVPYGLPEVTA